MKKVGLRAIILLFSLLACYPAAAEIELFGGNPLLDAIKANNPQEVEALLAADNNAEVEDFDRRRPLTYAAFLGSADIVELLVDHKVDINHRDKLGNSALFYAARQGEIEIVEILIDAGADKNAENRQGITPLMSVASIGLLDVVQVLINKGADYKRRDYTGRTALMWAQWNRRHAVVRALHSAGVRE